MWLMTMKNQGKTYQNFAWYSDWAREKLNFVEHFGVPNYQIISDKE